MVVCPPVVDHGHAAFVEVRTAEPIDYAVIFVVVPVRVYSPAALAA
jgi:hypothetical protein